MPPVLFEQERTATNFWYFATGGIPNAPEKFYYTYQIPGWVSGVRINNSFHHSLILHTRIVQNQQKYRALLLYKAKKVPLLWQVLANRYSGTDILFGTHRDRKGRSSIEMGLEAGGEKEAKVLLYPIGSTTPFRYQGPFSSSFQLLNRKSNFPK
jgi:protein disulfide-isomerase A6